MAAAFAPDNNNIVGIFQSFVYSVYSPIFRLHDVGGADVGLPSPLRHLVVHNNALSLLLVQINNVHRYQLQQTQLLFRFCGMLLNLLCR